MSARQAIKTSSKPAVPKRKSPSSPAPKKAQLVEADSSDEADSGDEADEPVERELDAEDGLGAPPLDEDGKSALKEDPVLDRRIIEGMLNDRKTLLDDLAKEGMTQAQVLRRAAELGLSEALLRQVKGVAADLAGERPGRRPAPSTLGARTCLSCDRVFLSTGPGNRLCMRCRGGDAGLAQF